ncbi:MAG: hypothetical protein ABW186_02925 [Rhodanobacteraceae bacterium]
MKTILAGLVLALAAGNAVAAETTCAVNVSNDPVVIRMDKDEFRIAFGVTGDACDAKGCSGVIRYRAAWRTEDGAEATDTKVLSYDIPSGSKRSIAVDRHYFDTSEGRHTTDLVSVSVDEVSCTEPRLTAGR